MKTITTLIISIAALTVHAQSPEIISYQAVVRDANNNLVSDQMIGMQISILQGSSSGTASYVETHTPVSNANGLVSIEIGAGSVVSGSLSTIDWANGPFFLKSETDTNGGTNYTISGTSQLLSVPYALHASTAESLVGGIEETDPIFTASPAKELTADDIAKLGNLSGTNNGDQDLSDLATKDQLGDSINLIRTEIPDVSALATEDQLADSIASLRGEIPDAQPTSTDDLLQRIAILEEIVIDADLYTVEDIDGNTYGVVKVGDLLWLDGDLKTNHLNDGTFIPAITDANTWIGLTTPARIWYDFQASTYSATYGQLYNWFAVNSGMLCPEGWHVATDEDWTNLVENLGGSDLAGGPLKEEGTTNWLDPNLGATNSSGFTARPGGSRSYVDGGFYNLGLVGYWWTSTEQTDFSAYQRIMSYNTREVQRSPDEKESGLCVRCVRD